MNWKILCYLSTTRARSQSNCSDRIHITLKLNACLQQFPHGIASEQSSHRSLHAHPSLRLDFACPGSGPVPTHMFFQEDTEFFFGAQVVEEIVRHECGYYCCIDAIGSIMRQSCLNCTTLDHEGRGWIDTNWRGAHSCATLLAGWANVPEKLLAIAHLQ